MNGAPGRTGTAAAPVLAVGPGEVYIWVLPRPWTHTDPAPLPVAELAPDERDRAAGLVRTGDRVRYLSAHVALRRLLSAYTAIAPADLRLGRDRCPCCGGPHGRPLLLDGPPAEAGRPEFSLAHSHQVAVLAVAATPVGVDVQRVPPAQAVRLCVPDLHPAERAEIAALPARRRPAAFARLWTRKEAYLKGLGTGLRRDPAADCLGGGPGSPGRPAGWSVADVPAPPGHAAAVAVRLDPPGGDGSGDPYGCAPPARSDHAPGGGPEAGGRAHTGSAAEDRARPEPAAVRNRTGSAGDDTGASTAGGTAGATAGRRTASGVREIRAVVRIVDPACLYARDPAVAAALFAAARPRRVSRAAAVRRRGGPR